MPILHVVMPVYNEGPTLQEILRRVLRAPLPTGWTLRVVMVDDGSAPAAAAAARTVAEGAAADGHAVALLAHPQNRGKGAALLTGFDHVLEGAADDDAAIVQDADLEYDPADYPALLNALQREQSRGGAAAVFGNRWGSGTSRVGAYRTIHAAANRALTHFSNLLTGLSVADMECCYKVVPVRLLRTIRPWLSEPRFGIEPQLAAALARAGATVTEVPVSYAPRTFAQGKKIRWTDGVHALTVIVREGIRSTPTLARLLAPRRALLQAVGFALGTALVAWVVWGALQQANDPTRAGILECVARAWHERPTLLAGIVLTTVASLVIDAALFWLVLLPVRRLAFMEVQWLTFVAALSNYFPVRLGIVVRYLYHMRANRLTALQCTGWFVAVTLVILASLLAVVVATAMDRHPGVLWAAIVLAVLALAGVLLQRLARVPALHERMGEWGGMLTTPSTFWAGALLRTLEVLLWIVRMWCASEILDLHLDFATVTILGVAAITMMLNPLGRLGFREATTAIVAWWLAGHTTDIANLDSAYKQLGLLESLGEMLTTLPLGIVAVPLTVRWYRRRRAQSAEQASGQRIMASLL